MRSIIRGNVPNSYTHYKDARNDLAERIGWFCSYCEMPVRNMIEVEHIHPVANGGNELDWDNFLLSCRYCNSVKKNNNMNRVGFFWPDVDNTPLAFEYSESNIIEPATGLQPNERSSALSSINLMGLNRTPHSGNEPTDADSRWIARINAIGIINESYNDWLTCPTQQFARQIARTATGHGFYSFWIMKFNNVQIVINEINRAFLGTYEPQYNNGIKVIRQNGSF
ncbi:HNH endonuclease [Xanthocytophaga flava]|uniref:HNH endonuclease n=1 Tax=Xanthocytophaga flava TaxID=3048013 RepID=UPI0028D7CDF9|nr:HNH endonuclease signature motif containing protein [Xanthocytophaga flavus]MDJ1470256.1 HNH endonuclease signature motif containing protein [Xanthocytophaga flavus]